MKLFSNRLAAGEELARHLGYLRADEPVVLGLANGGIPIAEAIACDLDATFDVLLIERLTAPGSDRIVGVVDEMGRISMIESSARWHHLESQEMIGPARDVFRNMQRKRGQVRAIMPQVEVANRTVLIVDEGVDTGARMLGAVASARDRGARKVVVAAPAGASNAIWQLHDTADAVVIPHQPTKFKGVEHFYEEYTAVSDDLMTAMLQRWITEHPRDEAGVQTHIIKVPKDDGELLCCELDLPPGATRGSGPYPAVLFAHGFESHGRSTRTLPISQRIAKRGIIGARLDFTGHGRSEGRPEEATDERMLADLRLMQQAITELQEIDGDRIGLNGSGSGGLIALRYAAVHSELKTLVIRGPVCGNEMDAAHHVAAPTLLIHAENDTALEESIEVIDRELASTHKLLRIPDCSRMFSDPISLELMIDATVDWLTDHLVNLLAPDQSPPKPSEAAG
jgi:predicted phosphoribosyltransferase/dienelactone hydrolase